MVSTLVKKGYVVTMNESRDVFPDGYVAFEDGKISAVGAADQLPEGSFDSVVDASGMLVCPGLINMHQHHWYNLFKGISEGFLLEEWLSDITLPLGKELTTSDLELSCYLASLEMLQTGTTCFVNHSLNVNTAQDLPAFAKPSNELGIRHLFCKEVRQKPGEQAAEVLAATEDLFKQWHDPEGLFTMGLVIETAAHWLKRGITTEELVQQGSALAHKWKMPISNHITGATLWRTIVEYMRETGRNDVEYLMQLGVLDERFLLIHCVWLNEREIDLVARTKANIVVCPASGAFTAGGAAPIKTFLEKGINVSLGSDGPMVNDSVDMVEQMKHTSVLQNVKYLTPAAIPPENLLEMATINAAKAIGMADRIGSLEVGKEADIAVFDQQRAHTSVALRPIANLVYSGKGTDVSHLFVKGRQVIRDGCMQTIDRESEREIITAAKKRSLEMVDKAGLNKYLSYKWHRFQ